LPIKNLDISELTRPIILSVTSVVILVIHFLILGFIQISAFEFAVLILLFPFYIIPTFWLLSVIQKFEHYLWHSVVLYALLSGVSFAIMPIRHYVSAAGVPVFNLTLMFFIMGLFYTILVSNSELLRYLSYALMRMVLGLYLDDSTKKSALTFSGGKAHYLTVKRVLENMLEFEYYGPKFSVNKKFKPILFERGVSRALFIETDDGKIHCLLYHDTHDGIYPMEKGLFEEAKIILNNTTDTGISICKDSQAEEIFSDFLSKYATPRISSLKGNIGYYLKSEAFLKGLLIGVGTGLVAISIPTIYATINSYIETRPAQATAWGTILSAIFLGIIMIWTIRPLLKKWLLKRREKE